MPEPGRGWRDVGLAADAFVLGKGREALPVVCRTLVALRAGASTGLASSVGKAPVEEEATDWGRDCDCDRDRDTYPCIS